MENVRKFTIVDTDSQQIKVIESSANTLRELKEDLIRNGFNVEDKSIQEGLTRTELISDDSILPRDVERNGVVTNDLVFRITQTNKKIKSGATSERSELYAKIKEYNLQEFVRANYHKSYANVPTETLKAIISNYECGASGECVVCEKKDTIKDTLINMYLDIKALLIEKGWLEDNAKKPDMSNCPYSTEELDEILDF